MFHVIVGAESYATRTRALARVLCGALRRAENMRSDTRHVRIVPEAEMRASRAFYAYGRND